MRTEDDLRTLFDDTAEAITAEDLPDELVAVGGIPVLPRITPKRRGWAAVLVAATAIAIILTAYAVVVGHRSGPVIIAGPPAGPTWVSTLNIPAGWELDMRRMLRGGTELIALRAVDDDKSCAAWTGPGDEAPGRLRQARPAEVGGHSAQVGRTSDDEVFGSAAWHVRWSPSPNRWADVTCGGDGEAVAAGLDFASVLHLGPTDAVLPVSLADLPYGLAANEVIIQGDIYPRGDVPRVMMTLISGLGPTPRPSLDPDEAERTGAKSVDAVVETLGTYVLAHPLDLSERLPDINGRDAWIRTTKEGPNGSVTVRALAVVDGDHVLYLHSTDYSSNELVEIATSMQLAHPLDEESGWYPLLTALGG